MYELLDSEAKTWTFESKTFYIGSILGGPDSPSLIELTKEPLSRIE